MSSTLGVSLLKLLTPGLELFAISQEGLVCQGSLVLQVVPIPLLIVFYCVLQDHNLHAFFNFFTGEFTLSNEGADSIGKGAVHLHPGVAAGLTEFGCSDGKSEHLL